VTSSWSFILQLAMSYISYQP